jgi:hypothetical protein
MPRRWLLAFCGLPLLSGCLYHAKERTDEAVCDLAARPYDLLPSRAWEADHLMLPAEKGAGAPSAPGKTAGSPAPATDVQTAKFMQADEPKPLRGCS